jgi:hypothetical protein
VKGKGAKAPFAPFESNKKAWVWNYSSIPMLATQKYPWPPTFASLQKKSEGFIIKFASVQP